MRNAEEAVATHCIVGEIAAICITILTHEVEKEKLVWKVEGEKLVQDLRDATKELVFVIYFIILQFVLVDFVGSCSVVADVNCKASQQNYKQAASYKKHMEPCKKEMDALIKNANDKNMVSLSQSAHDLYDKVVMKDTPKSKLSVPRHPFFDHLADERKF